MHQYFRVRVLVSNATFNNIFFISVLLVEETGDPRENHPPAAMLNRAHLAWARFDLTTFNIQIGFNTN